MSRTSTSSAPTSSPWLVSAPVDLLIGAGGWSLPILLLTGWAAISAGPALALLFYGATLLVNYPHYMATIVRAYRKSPRHRLATVWLTGLLLVGLVALHLKPALLPWVFAVYLTWSPFHYTAQNQGIATLFFRRAGVRLDARERLLFRWSFAATFWMWALGMHSGPSTPNLIRLDLDPAWTLPARIVLVAFFLSAVLYVLARVFGRIEAKQKAGVIAAAVVVVSQLSWFVLPWLLDTFNLLQLSPLYFAAGALAFMHCSQYLWIIFFSEKTERAREGLSFSAPRHYALLVGGGAVLFFVGPWILSRGFSYDLIATLLLFQAAVNIHHFLVDGVIWRLREPEVADALTGDVDVSADSPKQPWTPLRIGVAAGLVLAVAVGVVDVAQYQFTRPGASSDDLARANDLNPADPRVYLRRAELALSAPPPSADEAAIRAMPKENAKRALLILDEGLAVAPHNGDLLRARGTALAASGDFKGAYAHLSQLPLHLRNDDDTLLHLGALASEISEFKEGEANPFVEAEEWFNKVLARDPTHPEALRHLGNLALAKDDKAAAIDLLSRSLSSGAARALGASIEGAEPIDALIASSVDITTLDVAADLVHALIQSEQWNKAEVLLPQLTKAAVHAKSPRHALRAIGDAGRMHAGRGNLNRALASMQRGLRIADDANSPLDEAELWLSFARTLERADADIALRYAAVLQANEVGQRVNVGDGLRSFRLRKALFGNLTRMSEAMDPERKRAIIDGHDGYINEALRYRVSTGRSPPKKVPPPAKVSPDAGPTSGVSPP